MAAYSRQMQVYGSGPEAVGEASVSQFSRQEVLRIAAVAPRDLQSWERAGLLAAQERYGFGDLRTLRTLRELRARRMSARAIRRSLDAMQRALESMQGAAGPRTGGSAVERADAGAWLREVSGTGQRGRLHIRHAGRLIEPVSQQLIFDFDRDLARERAGRESVTPVVRPMAKPLPARELQELFLSAVRLEETGDLDGAVAGYERILAAHPGHAPTLINLGTIRYNERMFSQAERLYRAATAADPRYALAFFDLGNVLDETGRLPEAIEAYSRAVALVPHYADAHYNLALAYERQGQRRRALRHWVAYVRLDPTGPWSAHARLQARRTLKAEKLSIVSRRGRRVS